MYYTDILKKYDELIGEYKDIDFYFQIAMRHDDDYILKNFGKFNENYKYKYIYFILDDIKGDIEVYNEDNNFIEKLTINDDSYKKYLI